MLGCRSDATNNVIKRSQTARCSISGISFLLQTISHSPSTPRPTPRSSHNPRCRRHRRLSCPENKHTPFCCVKLKSCLLGYRLYGSWPLPPPLPLPTPTPGPFSLGFPAYNGSAAAIVPKLFAFNDRL